MEKYRTNPCALQRSGYPIHCLMMNGNKVQQRLCKIEGCEGRYEAKGFCIKHYKRYKRYGDPNKRLKKANGEGGHDGNGYRIIYVKGKRIFEHRHVMQEHLGRKLSPEEHIHHIDEDKDNNDITNLKIVTNAEHQKLHQRYFVSETHKQCISCLNIFERKFFYDHASRCKECTGIVSRYYREIKNHTNVKRGRESGDP